MAIIFDVHTTDFRSSQNGLFYCQISANFISHRNRFLFRVTSQNKMCLMTVSLLYYHATNGKYSAHQPRTGVKIRVQNKRDSIRKTVRIQI